MSDHHTAQQPFKKEETVRHKNTWNPRTKLISGLIYVFGVISLGDVRLLLAAFVFAVLYAYGRDCH